MRFIRDAEIEHYLQTLSYPIFRAASLNPKAVQLVIIENPSLNAFVAGGQNIFLFTGLLQKTETPGELAGVIAHETGHIAGGHLIRAREASENASTQAIITMIAGIAAGIAMARGDVAMGALMGAQSAAERGLLKYTRSQESSADTAALNFLTRAGYSAKGMLSFMKKLGAQELIPDSQQTAYTRTHPLTQTRIDHVEHFWKKSAYKNVQMPIHLKAMHQRMKTKLFAYLHPEAALLRTSDGDTDTNMRLARAIAYYRTDRPDKAEPIIDELIKAEPRNPFFLEIKAQMLFENGRIEEAIVLYARSINLLPDSSLLLTAYAHALLEGGQKEQINLALEQLIKADRLEPQSPGIWRLIAACWSRLKEITKDDKYQGLISYARAEEASAKGLGEQASVLASRALEKLEKGSPYWLRAQDIKIAGENSVKD